MTANIEEVRRYWDARPCNIRHSNAPFGTRQYFDECEARKRMVEPHIEDFAQFPLWKGKSVLEIGMGTGADAVRFAIAGAYYTGIDLSERSAQIALDRFGVYGLIGRFIVGDAERLQKLIPPRQFDLIYAFGSIHHTPCPEKIVEQVKTFMGPDSEFRLMLYAKRSWKHIMIEFGLDQPEAQANTPIWRAYTESEVRELLAGYEITSIEQAHIFPYQIEKYVQYVYEVEPWFAAMSRKMFTALERRLGWHMLIKAKLK